VSIASSHATDRTMALSSAAPPRASASAVPSPAALARYQAELERGVQATKDGDYAAADSAFGEALKVRHQDELVLAERMHERMLAGRNAEARRDARGAWSADLTIHARIYFDLGVLAERRKDELEARDYFTKSRNVLPTPEAMSKLAGRMQCPGEITRIEDWRLKEFPNWVAAFRGLSSRETNASTSSGLAEQGAKSRLSVAPNPPGFTLQSDASDVMYDPPVWHYALQAADGSLAVLGDLDYGQELAGCGGGPSVTTRVREGVLWVTSETEDYASELDEEGAKKRCRLTAWRRNDFFVAQKAKRILMRIRQEDTDLSAKTRFQYSLAKNALTLRGNGCNWTIPLEPDAEPEPEPAHDAE